MIRAANRSRDLLTLSAGLVCLGMLAVAAPEQPAPIRLQVDASTARRKIFHVREEIPVSPGEVTLYFVKWIPGEHSPSGQITNLVNLKITAGGKLLPWHRDTADMFAFHCKAPAGESQIEVVFDYLSPTEAFDFQGGVSAAHNTAIVNWNQMLLYPKGWTSDALTFQPSLQLPAGWRYGTALQVESASGDYVSFRPVSLTTLVDSPVNLGAHYRRIDLSPGSQPAHYMDLVADSEAALQLDADTIESYKRLVAEAVHLFNGTHHYREYHFLVTLSDPIAKIAQEHHESSDNRFRERALLEPESIKAQADVLPHEFAHSWNGKYRRPAGLATPDYQEAMDDSLLWVYEGLTQYLGEVLAARSGAWTADEYRQNLALTAALLDHRSGRTWRALEDTAVSAQLLYFAPEAWAAKRRGTDFYPEGTLVWLAADATIRQQSQGRRSLDDFCHLFHGDRSGPAELRTYTFDDLLSALNQVQTYDWRGFFDRLVKSINPRAPLDGVEGSGWRLAYRDTIPSLLKAREHTNRVTDLSYSIGLLIKTPESGADSGKIVDVITGSPADQAGLTPGMTLLAVNGKKWSPEILRSAIRDAKAPGNSLEVLAQDGEFFGRFTLEYHQGERYPFLERDSSRPDLLEQIIQPAARGAAAGSPEEKH